MHYTVIERDPNDRICNTIFEAHDTFADACEAAQNAVGEDSCDLTVCTTQVVTAEVSETDCDPNVNDVRRTFHRT